MAISLITAKDVATMLHYQKPDKVYLLVRSGLLKGFKRGRIWLIDKESVDKYIRQQLGYYWFLIIPFHIDCVHDCDHDVQKWLNHAPFKTSIKYFTISGFF